MSQESKNTSGQAYSLTVMAPILSGHASRLASVLDEFGTGAASPLARVPSTHFARWVVMDALVYEGGMQRRENWSAARLLFTSNFDGPLDRYLGLLCTNLGADADAVWGHCAGYPGREDAAAFADWMRRHQLTSSLFFAAYGEQTVEDVAANLAVRTQLTEFAASVQGLGDAELHASFQERFPA